MSQSRRKLIGRLRSPRLRSREGLFLAEGTRVVREALRATNPPRIRFGLCSSGFLDMTVGRTVARELDDARIPVEEISDGEFKAVSDTATPQGILLVVEEPRDPLKEEGSKADSPGTRHVRRGQRILLLDGLQDPGNAGTLLRAAWGFGVNSVVFLEGSVDPWSPKVVRAGAGAHFHLELVRRRWEEVRPQVASCGFPLYVADSRGRDVRSVPEPGAWVLVVGNEGAGVRREIHEASDGALAVPISQEVDSLNAGVAGAILLFVLSGGGDET